MHCPYRPQWFQRFRTAVSAYSLQMSRRLKMPRLSSRSSIQWIRVWGVKVTLGYEGKRSRVTRTSDRGGPAHGDRCLSWARSPHHLLRFCLPSQILAVCEGKLTKIFFTGLRPAPRWGSAPDPAGAPPQTPAGAHAPDPKFTLCKLGVIMYPSP